MEGSARAIAVIGGSGTLGAPLVAELRARGHTVRVLSRRSAEFPVDLTTGAGLGAGLAGCEVVVDASNNSSVRGAKATLVDGTGRLLDAAAANGVGHLVCISIVGCERAPMGYYKVKTEQERLVSEGPVPWSIVRATQFHELVAWLFGTAARFRLLPSLRAKVQTVAAAEVAKAVAGVAEGAPLRRRFEVAGPEVLELRELARTWRTATGRRALLVPVVLPGRLGRALREGALTNEQPDVRGTITFADWIGRARPPA
jgi:uncharacterized protein YbjT (DUF2867 family)